MIDELIANSRLTFFQGKYEDALVFAKQAIAEDEHDSNAHQCAGNAYMSFADYESAINHYKKALENDADNGDRYFNLGYAYASDNQPVKALEMFAKADEVGCLNDPPKMVHRSTIMEVIIMKKNLVVTITIVTAISLSILTGCGNTQTTSSDPLTTSSTTIEQTIDMTDEATTTDTQEATTTTTQTPTTESTNPAHVHTWTTETYYTTETQVVHHGAVTHVVHHDAVTHQETVTTYTTKTTTVHHDGCYVCRGCGATFNSESATIDHMLSSLSCAAAGCEGSPGWDETVTTQVPHTETVTVVDQEAWDETVVDTPAWDETVEVQVPHTRTVCSECGATK